MHRLKPFRPTKLCHTPGDPEDKSAIFLEDAPFEVTGDSGSPILKCAGTDQTSDSSHRFFRSHVGVPMETRFEDGDSALIVKGISFDKISKLGAVCPRPEGSHVPSEVTDWHSLAMLSRSSYETAELKERAFAYTIKADLRTHHDMKLLL